VRRDRLTVILGAGASAAAGAPTAHELSQSILSMQSPRIIPDHPEFLRWPKDIGSPVHMAGRPPSVATIELIKRGLLLGQQDLNFEIVLHAIETLETYAATISHAPETLHVRPVIASFTDPMPRFQQLFNYSALVATRWEIIHLIRSTIMESLANAPADVTSASRSFINELRLAFGLDVQDLNYDTLWDSFGLVDGFRSEDTAHSVFDRRAFAQALEDGSDIMCHTHGSILYGYPMPGSSVTMEPRSLVKYQEPEEASQSLAYLREPRYIESILDEEAPIISGAHKIQKLSSAPYSYYYEAFQRAIQRNSRLMFIGYGFSDPHFNRWALELIRIHGNTSKVAIIDKKPERGVKWSLPINQTFCEVAKQLGNGSLDLTRDARELAICGGIAISGFGYPLRSDLTAKLIRWLKD
jgi:hypothetical protein